MDVRSKYIGILKPIMPNKGVGGTDPLTSAHDSLAGNNLNNLASGSIAFLNDKGALQDLQNPNFEDSDFFQIAVGNEVQGYADVSPLIDRKTVRVDVQNYVAPVKEVTFLGNDLATGTSLITTMPIAAKGNIIGVFITLVSQFDVSRNDKYSISYSLSATDTKNSAITALIAKINTVLEGKVVATVVGAQVGISFTTVEYNINIVVAGRNGLENASVIKDGASNSISVVYGSGMPSQIARYEDSANVNLGDTSRMLHRELLFNKNSLIDTTKQYDIYTFSWDSSRGKALNVPHTGTSYYILAIPNDYPDGANPADYYTQLKNTIAKATNIALHGVEVGA